MFARTLFIGAMLGAAVGGAEHVFLPHLSGSPGTYALVGMGVLFAGFLRAPMTSVFMVLEVSGNYSIILPVIVANTFAYVISRGLQPTARFDVLTRQVGLDLPSMEEQREADILRVEDAIRPTPTPVLDGQETVDRAAQRVDESKSEIFLVRLSPSGWGSVNKHLNRRRARKHWKRWGPYVSERSWGTVREDYSPDGNAWECSHASQRNTS